MRPFASLEPADRLTSLAASILTALTISCMTISSADAKKPRVIPVVIAEAKEQLLHDRVEALGTLKAKEQVTVTAQVTEIVTALHFDDGQRVKTGDILAEMTSAEERAQLQQAEATLKEAKEQLDRATPLAKRGVSSQATLSERRRNYQTALAQIETMKSRLADRQIRAPFGGVIGLRRISVGALVQPGTVVATIDDDSVMKLDFTIPAPFLETIRNDLPIVAKAKALGDRTFTGKVTGIDSRVDPVTRSITVRAVLPNEDGLLKAGILMTVEIQKNTRTAIVIPEEAVVARGTNTFVYVVDPKADKPIAQKRQIKIGTREFGQIEVIEGLKKGEFIITHGVMRTSPGAAVTIKATDDGKTPVIDLINRKPS